MSHEPEDVPSRLSQLRLMEESFSRLPVDSADRTELLDQMIAFVGGTPLCPTVEWYLVFELVKNYGTEEQKQRLSDSQRVLLHPLRARVL